MSVDAALRAWAEGELGAPVAEPTAIGSGASRQIWRLETGDGRRAVLRIDTGTGPVAGTPLDLAREAAVYGVLAGRGLPVPEVIAVAPGGDALLMDFAEGDEALAAVEDPDRRQRIGCDYLGWLGRLHLVDVGAADLGPLHVPSDGPGHALDDRALWASIRDERTQGFTTPAVDAALDWLGEAAPARASATSLCHGDAGPGNFLFAADAVTALLDWEFAHIGDPHDDLAWVSVRNHLLGRPLDVPAAASAWRAATGLAVEPDRLEYYRVFVLTRMAISCDASLAWKHGVEDESIRTQAILRPWLGQAITAALAFAGCDDRSVRAVADAAAADLGASPYASLLALIPPLEAFGPW